MLIGTDNLMYEIKTEDVYADFDQDKNLLDISDYSLSSNFFDLVNKKVISKMKNEFKGKIISIFLGLKSKMYSLIDVDDDKLQKQKK